MTALRFIYCWSQELTSMEWGEKQLDLTGKEIVDWNNYYLKEVCMNRKSEQKDESLFTKRKNQVGSILPEQRIYLGDCAERDQRVFHLKGSQSKCSNSRGSNYEQHCTKNYNFLRRVEKLQN